MAFFGIRFRAETLFSAAKEVSMVSNNVLTFPKGKKIPSSDPVVLTHQIFVLLAGTKLLAKLSITVFETFGLEVILWFAAYRTYIDLVSAFIDEMMLTDRGIG
jgi:hypothetical protein